MSNARCRPTHRGCRVPIFSNVLMNDEASYICDFCGEEIVVPVDPSAGRCQQYVEDCPVCCNPNVINVRFDSLGRVICDGHAEQDRD